MKNFLSIESCSREYIESLICSAEKLKESRENGDFGAQPLKTSAGGLFLVKHPQELD